MSVSAPKTYVAWLKNKDEEILDHLPETKKFKGCAITRFLLNEATDEIRELILQVLLIYLPEDLYCA